MRAAASSIASGRPSSRRQIAATAGGVLVGDAKSGRTAARALDEQRHRGVLRASSASGGSRLGSGSASGGTGILLLAAEAQRLPAGHQRLTSRAARAAGRPRAGAAARICSKLSSTSSSRGRQVLLERVSQTGRLAAPRARRAPGDRAGTSVRIVDRRQRRRRRRRRRTSAAGSAATRRLRRVLPVPPGPVQRHQARPPDQLDDLVDLPLPRRRSWSVRRQVGRRSMVRGGGNSSGTPAIDELNEALGPLRSLSRCSPRSRSSRPSRQEAFVSRGWPPTGALGRRGPPPRSGGPVHVDTDVVSPPSVPSPVCRPIRTRTEPASAATARLRANAGRRRRPRPRQARSRNDEEGVALGGDLDAARRRRTRGSQRRVVR